MTLLAIAGRGPFGITLNHLFALPAPRSDPEMTHAILCCCGKPFAYINQPYGGEPVASTRWISIDSNLRNEPSAWLWLALTISEPLRGVMISQWRTLCVSSLWYAKLVSLFSWEKLVCNRYKNKNISRLNILCTNIFFRFDTSSFDGTFIVMRPDSWRDLTLVCTSYDRLISISRSHWKSFLFKRLYPRV